MMKYDEDKMSTTMITMAYQHIPTRHIPTRWEYVIMNRGGNVTLSYSHHIYISIIIIMGDMFKY